MSSAPKKIAACLLLASTSLILGCHDGHKKPRSWTILHTAVVDQDLSEVERCIAEGVDINAMDEYGRTPLRWAARYGNVDIAKALIAHGADTNDGSLAQAVAARHRPMVDLLLSNRAIAGGSPLVQAAMYGNVELARLLIDKGADVDAKGVELNSEEPAITDCARYGETPLWAACGPGHLEVIRLLLEQNADVNIKSRYGYPLGRAAEYGHRAIVVLLLARAAKTDAKNTAGKTAAQLADENGHKDIGDIIRGAENKSKS